MPTLWNWWRWVSQFIYSSGGNLANYRCYLLSIGGENKLLEIPKLKSKPYFVFYLQLH